MSESFLERAGVKYFALRSARLPRAVAEDAVYFLNPHERAGLRSVVRGAAFRAGLAGALSGGASAWAEVSANPLLPAGASLASRAALPYWALLGGVTLAASIVEIAFLYWDTLRSAHSLAHVAGLELFEGGDREIAGALARAALELPNPVTGPHGINSHKEASRGGLLAASLAYKLKIGVTNFLFKLFVRRVLGRVLVRSVVNNLVPFVAVPVTALWNALVTLRVMREARLRAMGPSVAKELAEAVFADAQGLTSEGRLAAVRAVACAIVRTRDLHPNLLALLRHVQACAGDTGEAALDNPREFLSSLRTLTPVDQRLALQTLSIACVVDGRITTRERKFLREALLCAGRTADLAPVERLRRAFVQGEGLDHSAVAAL